MAEGETGHNGDKKELLEVFKRLIDRNLVAGFGARTLSGVRWGAMSDDTGDIGVSTRGDGGHKSQPPAASKMASAKSVSTPKRKSMKAFSCALGKTILPSHLHTLFTPSSPKWFASRKLDGVRVITYLDFHLSPNSPSQGIVKPIISAIQHLSRSGNIFTSLGNLGSPLAVIADYPGLAELLKDDSASLPSTEGDSEGSGAIRRLVLDGEVCVMRTRLSSSDDPIISPSNVATQHTLSGLKTLISLKSLLLQSPKSDDRTTLSLILDTTSSTSYLGQTSMAVYQDPSGRYSVNVSRT